MKKYFAFVIFILFFGAAFTSCIAGLNNDFEKIDYKLNKNLSKNIIKQNLENSESSQDNWWGQDVLFASDGTEEAQFSRSISIDGDYAIIGAVFDDENGLESGSAYIFKNNDTGWNEETKLLASDGEEYDHFGLSVSIYGDYAIVGASGDDDNDDESGAAYIFKHKGSSWIEQAKLIASDGLALDHFGGSVSILEDYAMVGAYGHEYENHRGAVYVFKHNGTNWNEETKLLPLTGGGNEHFGGSIIIDGDYAIIGASGNGDNGAHSGAAFIYKRNETGWMLDTKLLPSDGSEYDQFGDSVSLCGDYAIIGAPNDNENGIYSGSAYIFKHEVTNWTEQVKLVASDRELFGGYFGGSVSIDGDYVIIGEPYKFRNGIFTSHTTGAAYIFKRDDSTWVEQSKLIAPKNTEGELFGFTVCIKGNHAFVGAICNNVNGYDSGSVYVFKTSNFSCEIKGGIGAKIIITNNGNEDITDKNIKIYIYSEEGYNVEKYIKTIDIPSGESTTIKTGMFVYRGFFDIILSIDDGTKTVTGFQLSIFTIIR